jgi:magnesium transporter
MSEAASRKKEENLGKWHRSTAGFYMTRAVPIVNATAKAAAVRAYLHTKVKEFATIDYIYVVDHSGAFVGILSYRTLLSASPRAHIKEICTTAPLFSVRPESPADDVAHHSLHHAVSSIAVVDKQNHLVGVIPAAGIVRMLHCHRIEALFHQAGIDREHALDTVMKTPFLKSVRHRIVWLVLGLFGGLLAAKIIGLFEHTLEQNILLAAFIPLVVYLADAVRTQLEAFTIRDLAIFRHVQYTQYFMRQLAIVALIAVLLSLLAFCVSFLMYQQLSVSHVIALAIFSASLISVITGILVPIASKKFALDPANVSGPIGTIIQDVLSVSVYFLIAAWLL